MTETLPQVGSIDLLRKVGDLSQDGAFICNPITLQVSYVNDKFASVFEKTKEELLNSSDSLLQMVSTEDISYLQHQHAKLLATGSINDAEFRLHTPGGSARHVSCDVFTVDNETAFGFVKDISLQKEHEDYLTTYGAKKDILLDIVAHHLSRTAKISENILNGIRSGSDKASITHKLEIIHHEANRSVNIIRNFLIKEHRESENVYIRKTRFDLLQKLQTAVDKMMAANMNKKIELITTCRNLNINTDIVKFFQIIHHLVSNAVQFTPDGGDIYIAVEEYPETFVVHVHDNGTGMPIDLLGALQEYFDPATGDHDNNLQLGGLNVV
ncbi:MAG TPA: PAS domain-containing sensor histidine kinase, partial [Chitinophagaceae bacterium]